MGSVNSDAKMGQLEKKSMTIKESYCQVYNGIQKRDGNGRRNKRWRETRTVLCS